MRSMSACTPRLCARVRRANELVVRDAEPLPHRLESAPRCRRRTACGATPRSAAACATFCPCSSMPDEEVDVVAAQPVVPGDDVGADLLERVPEVRVAVGVVDGGGEVEPRHVSSLVRRSSPPRRPRRRRRVVRVAAGASRRAAVAASAPALAPASASRRRASSRRRSRRPVSSVDVGDVGASRRDGRRSRHDVASVVLGDVVDVDARAITSDARRRPAVASSAQRRRSTATLVVTRRSRLAISPFNSAQVGERTTRVSPSAARSVTRSRKMSFATTFSSPLRRREDLPFLREALPALHVELVLVAQAAHQPPARAGDLRRVERQPLVLRDAEVDRAQLGQPRRRAVLRGRSGRCRRGAWPRRARRSA